MLRAGRDVAEYKKYMELIFKCCANVTGYRQGQSVPRAGKTLQYKNR